MEMKKNLFYFAMAFCVALCNVACSSDDGDDSGKNNNNNNNTNTNSEGYTAPVYAEQATAFTINEGTVTETARGGEKVELRGVNFTESAKAVFELRVNEKLKYVTYDVDINGDIYTVRDGSTVLGTITRVSASRVTRAGVTLVFNFKLIIPDVGEVTFKNDNPVSATELPKVITGGDVVATWLVERMKLTLDFDEKTDASTEVGNGSLKKFLELAEENNVSLSEKDRADLDKEIASFTIDKFGLFSLNYANGKGSDAAKWSWVGGDTGKMAITLKDADMGNKFLKDNSTIEVKYPGDNKIVLKMTTRLDEDKCTAVMTVNLKK